MVAMDRSCRAFQAPLDQAALETAALSYVERFQTSEARLVRHLRDKLRRRGWCGEGEPDPAAVAARLAALGYVDDAAFAAARARTMARRGLGPARLRRTLAGDGIGAENAEGAMALHDPRAAALAYARRRRLGPFGPPADAAIRAKQFAAMLRAGHEPAIVRALLSAADVAAAEALLTAD